MTAEAPIVARSWAQPGSGSGASGNVPVALPQPQEIGFFGSKEGKSQTFRTLAGEGAPTLTGGWVKLAKVQRFQRVSITVPEGYDPLVLTVPLMFDEVSKPRQAGKLGGQNNEEKILSLEWMAGRGAHATATGEPPKVEVYSLKAGDNHQSNLVPKPFQSEAKSEQLWWITGITFDPNPLRDAGGERVRQACSVELTEIILSASGESRAQKEHNEAEGKFKSFNGKPYYTTTDQINTYRKIASVLIGRAPESDAWKEIAEANPKLGNNAEKHFKSGMHVKIPLTIYHTVTKE